MEKNRKKKMKEMRKGNNNNKTRNRNDIKWFIQSISQILFDAFSVDVESKIEKNKKVNRRVKLWLNRFIKQCKQNG